MAQSIKQNKVYSEFVDEDTDLVGMIAYSIYKGEKIAFIEKLKMESKSEEEKDVLIDSFSNEAIEKKQDYFEKAFKIAENFADALFKDVVDEEARATLLAENRRGAKWLHLGLTFIWGVFIVIGFYFLMGYLNEIKDSSLYKPGVSFKDKYEIAFYLFERFSRRIFVVGSVFFAIRILWYNFKLSFNSFIMNMHYSDNLRVFDYVKGQFKDKETLVKDLSKYVFVDNHTKDTEGGSNESSVMGQKLLDKITEKIDTIFDSASKIVSKKD